MNNQKLKPILIITYYWPPGSGPGVQRWLKFSKYLPEFGWQPIILTVKNGSYPSIDETLLKEVSDENIIYRTRAIEPFALYNMLRGKKGNSIEVGMGNIKDPKGVFAKISNYIRANYFIPDARIGWNYLATKKALEIIDKHKPLLIVTTGPPHSTHLIGVKIKEKHPDLNWVVDLRDPWTEIFYNKFLKRTKGAKIKDVALETLVLTKADFVIAATPSIQKIYSSRAQKMTTVLNGYDDKDFFPLEDLKKKDFTISFFGNMLPNQNLSGFWQAIKELQTLGSLPSYFKIRLVGNIAENIRANIKALDLDSLIEYKPFLNHLEAIIEMQKSNMLYLPIPIDEGNKLIITGKIFEYLATGRPILSIGPKDGDASEILKACNQLEMHDYDDVEAVKKEISEAIMYHRKTNELQNIGNSYHLELTRKSQTQKLVYLINSMS